MTTRQIVEQRLKDRAEEVNQCLDDLLPPGEQAPGIIHQSMRYSVMSGGKRLRPVLLLETARLLCDDPHVFLPAACAIELIHTYSLVHDDLPAMDNDDYRRGRLTSHKVYGEGIAVLTGDALLTAAFEQLALLNQQFPGREQQLLEATSELANAIGTRGMVGGQVLDLEAEGKVLTLDELRRIHYMKTGCLFEATIRFPALLLKASSGQLAALTTYAQNFGVAFQIVDDILDVAGDEEKMGKRKGSDVANNKATYPTLIGLAASRLEAQSAVKRAVDALQVFGARADFLVDLAQFVIERDH